MKGDEKAPVAYFRSKDCRIQIYDSTRDGSINCLIAALDAPKVFGPHDQTGNWQCLPGSRFGKEFLSKTS